MKGNVMKALAVTAVLLCALAMPAGCVTRDTGLRGAELTAFFAEDVWIGMEVWDDFIADGLFLESSLFNTFGLEAVPMTAEGAPFHVPMPSAPGSAAESNDFAVIDYSNASDGYVMVKFPQHAGQSVPVIVMPPNPSTRYDYFFSTKGDFEIIPLSEGNGEYTVVAGEFVSGGNVAALNMATFNVTLSDPFAPFLRPNRYVNYTLDSKVVKLARELIGGQSGLIERIKVVYDFVINHFEYDWELAANHSKDYVPDLDYVLDYKKAICYGYSSVMTAMLRSQGIITKLVFGYMADGTYHAWIDVYSDQEGWLSGVVFFDGNGWSLIDPTTASSGGEAGERYFMNPANYTVRTVY